MAHEAAPGELELVRAFINTNDVEEGVDELATPEQLRDWLAEKGFRAGEEPLGASDSRLAIEVREALRALLHANNGEPLDRDAVEVLNRFAGEARLQVRFGGDGRASLAAACEGVDAALGAILAIVYQSMAEGNWPRLKACRDDTCQWAFYDRSRNRSATWCSMEVCGNRSKARSYRRRHAQGAGD
jgi:predicted RNA-binding Zn ribbon-like protein